jgi:azurin
MLNFSIRLMGRQIILAQLLMVVLIQFSCGDSASSGIKSANGVREITIKISGTSMADMRYNPNSIHVQKGDKVKLTLINSIRTEGLYQNWVLVNLGTAQEVVNNAMSEGTHNNYVPAGKNVLTATTLAAPGQQVELTFNAPSPGTYQFISTFPGNYPKMTGKLVVE